jgi:hypothetical protein
METPNPEPQPQPRDAGFKRAMLLGLATFALVVASGVALTGAAPSATFTGRTLLSDMVPAFITGMFVNGRGWPWWKIGVAFVVLGVPIMLVTLVVMAR